MGRSEKLAKAKSDEDKSGAKNRIRKYSRSRNRCERSRKTESGSDHRMRRRLRLKRALSDFNTYSFIGQMKVVQELEAGTQTGAKAVAGIFCWCLWGLH